MKKKLHNYLKPILLSFAVCIGLNAESQVAYIGQSDTLVNGNGPFTMTYTFQTPPTNAYSDAILTVFVDGDYSATFEYIDVYSPTGTLIGSFSGTQDCPGFFESQSIIIPFDSINVWFDGVSNVQFTGITTSGVNNFCNDLSFLQLEYNQCAGGIPSAFASVSLANYSMCSTGDPVAITFSPAGGTLSGTNVVGTDVNPTGLLPGSYYVTYSQLDVPSGCTTTDSVEFIIQESPGNINTSTCPGTGVEIIPSTSTSIEYHWFNDVLMTSPIDSANTWMTPILTSGATYYYAEASSTVHFQLELTDTAFAVVDHNTLTGDDRGGVITTPNYVYVVGDNNIGRFDLDLTNPMSYPLNDGLFSDLSTGSIYTLHDGTTYPVNYPGSFSLTELRELDSDLLETGMVVTLSETIEMNSSGQNGIFAGNGIVILYNTMNQTWYVINIQSGQVTNLGVDTGVTFFSSENWSVWGVAEYNALALEYSALYRTSAGPSIVRRNLSSFTEATEFAFTNISDLASFSYSPWNERIYFHYEGSGQFGGTTETFGYFSGTDTTGTPGEITLSCPSEINITVNTIDLGQDTIFCAPNSITLDAGLGYSSYSWNGDNSNFNSYVVTATSQVILEAVDGEGCTIKDTIEVTVNPEAISNFSFNQTTAYAFDFTDLSTGTPTTWIWDFGDGTTDNTQNPSHTYVGEGNFIVTLTVTNDCNTDMYSMNIGSTVGIETSTNEFSIYPNPNNGQFIINAKMIGSIVNIYSIDGAVILSNYVLNNTSNNIELLDIESGVYFVTISNDENQKSMRIVIE